MRHSTRLRHQNFINSFYWFDILFYIISINLERTLNLKDYLYYKAFILKLLKIQWEKEKGGPGRFLIISTLTFSWGFYGGYRREYKYLARSDKYKERSLVVGWSQLQNWCQAWSYKYG